MDPQFWHERWENGQIGFHQERINPYLQQFLPRLALLPGARIFVPLCGKSRDMAWLCGQGYKVLGVEISAIAVRDFFAESGLKAERTEQSTFVRWESGPVRLLCGDFFDLTPGDLENVAAVYDRASLIALPAPMRRRYCAHMAALLPAGTPYLLVTLEYPEDEMEGPPFPVEEEEAAALFGECFRIQPLERRDVLEAHPGFRERGLSRLSEAAYLLRRV